jgi:hypothetical protein
MSHRKQTIFGRVTDTLVTHARYQVARAMMDCPYRDSHGRRKFTKVDIRNRCLYVHHQGTVYKIETLKAEPLKYVQVLTAIWEP